MEPRIGDKVRITNRLKGHLFDIGEICTIKEICPNDHYKINNDDTFWYLIKDEFEIMKTYKLIKSYPGHEKLGETIQEDMSKYPEYWEEIKKNFKIGDYITVLDTFEPNDNLANKNYIGKTFCIENIEKSDYLPSKQWVHFKGYSFGAGSVREATPEEIQEAKGIKIGDYKVELLEENMFKIGCQVITRRDLGVVESLLKSPTNAKITIHGTEITKELIQKIKNL